MRDHGFEEREAHAAAAAADGSIGRALEGDSEAYVEARDAAEAMLKHGGAGSRRRRSGWRRRRALGGDKVDRDELGRRLRLVASMLRDLGVLLSRADERCAGQRRSEAGARAAAAGVRRRPRAARVRRGRPGAQALDRNASPKIVADWVAFQV